MNLCDWSVIVLIGVACFALGWVLWVDYQLEQWKGYAARLEREAELYEQDNPLRIVPGKRAE